MFDELIQNVGPPIVREQYRAEATRRLANYIASALALVDHVRRLTRGSNAPHMDEFRRRCQSVSEQPEIGFIRDLRNFTLHRRLPVFGHRAAVGQGRDQTFAVTLQNRDLIGWSGWSAKGKELIEANPAGIDLASVIERHGYLMLELNGWIHDRLQEEYESTRQELNSLVRRYNAALLGIPVTSRLLPRPFPRIGISLGPVLVTPAAGTTSASARLVPAGVSADRHLSATAQN